MSVEFVLARGRAAALARATSRVTIRRATGETAQNEATGLEEPVWDVIHTDLPFRLDGGSSSDGGSRSVVVGGVEYEQATAVGHLPFDATDLADGDLIDITAGEWLGSVWRVVKATAADQKTERRVPIESAFRPTEWGA